MKPKLPRPGPKSKPFGDRFKNRFKPGDLVSFPNYPTLQEGPRGNRSLGIVVKVYVTTYDQMRSYWMAEVFDNKTQEHREVLLGSLKMEQSA